MNNHVNIGPADAALCPCNVDALGALRGFLVRDAEGLREILELFGDFGACDAVVEVASLCSAAQPDPKEVGVPLQIVLHALESVPFLFVEQAATLGLGPRDLHAALRWYGGRLSEFSARLPA